MAFWGDRGQGGGGWGDDKEAWGVKGVTATVVVPNTASDRAGMEGGGVAWTGSLARGSVCWSWATLTR